jgi:hypothetical protein
MSGNVWEWCEDVWHANYKGAPDNGSAWIKGGEQNRRVVRGGSWIYSTISTVVVLTATGTMISAVQQLRVSFIPVLTLLTTGALA